VFAKSENIPANLKQVILEKGKKVFYMGSLRRKAIFLQKKSNAAFRNYHSKIQKNGSVSFGILWRWLLRLAYF
jgi:hypothetical protein